MKITILPILIFSTILFFVTSFYLGIKLYKCNKESVRIAVTSFSLDSAADVIKDAKSYTDDSGRYHVVVDDRLNEIIENRTNERVKELTPIIEKVAENIGVKPSQIEGATTISSRATRDSVAFLLRQLESANMQSFYYRDRYLTLKATINPLDSSDKGVFDYSYDNDINIVQYNKKNWFLGSKHGYIDISSNDPNATIMGVKRFTVKQNQPSYGLRIQGTAGYSQNTNAFSIGPSARVDIGGFIKGSFRASYLYNTQTKTWGLSATVDKDIFRF